MYDLATDIVNKGADLHRLDKYGNDALWTSVLNPRPSLPLIELLVIKGADPHRKKCSRTALGQYREYRSDQTTGGFHRVCR